MDGPLHSTALTIFILTLVGTFAASYAGRRHSRGRDVQVLAGQQLNRWLIGLSAGATANSGFVVTGAVGLGYTFGLQAFVLPLAWLVGDLLFWWIFPERINRAGFRAQARTLSDLIVFQVPAPARAYLRSFVSWVTLLCLGGYVSAQWLAGQKFLHGAFGFGGTEALIFFAALIVLYSAIGGFRGSVYADSFQAVVRIIGTIIAVGAVTAAAREDTTLYWENTARAGQGFYSLLGDAPMYASILSAVGFAAAALGFGLGQPQLASRYMAGASPSETKAAWWIYVGFVQFTWIAMTGFGVVLRGVMPDLVDPEAGLSRFFVTMMGPVLTGIIVADVFATIAATANGLLVTMAQTLRFDVLDRRPSDQDSADLWISVAVLGLATMVLSTQLTATVLDVALTAISLMGAGLAPAVIVRVMGWRWTGASLTGAVVVGMGSAVAWRVLGLSGVMNESGVGIAAGLAVNTMLAIRKESSGKSDDA